MPASIGTLKQVAEGADSPRKPISTEKVYNKGRYVNMRGGFQQTSLLGEAIIYFLTRHFSRV